MQFRLTYFSVKHVFGFRDKKICINANINLTTVQFFCVLALFHLTQFFLGLIRHIRRGTTVSMFSWHKFLYMNIWYKYSFYSQTPCYYWISCRLIWKLPSFWSYLSWWWRYKVSWIGKFRPTTSSCCWWISERKAHDLWRLLW